jgi:hypothetical protein
MRCGGFYKGEKNEKGMNIRKERGGNSYQNDLMGF